ncbi:MAG TPA: ATP-binding protein [Thermodesulfobacteriota bacterium]|jgi:signal transduction histidine kinase|nr:ATP-binding protein [Thermodesulfobacteriota bacterium]
MRPNGRKILVVDDNVEYVDMVRRLLESRDFQVSIATNGKAAVEKVVSDIPELVLLDLKLPDIPGEEVLNRIKEIDKDVAVVVVTGFGGEEVAVDLMRRGALDFLSKPIENEVLFGAVKNALEIRDAQTEGRQYERYPSLDRFFPFLAHEVRNPLHAISGALAIIQRRSDSKDELLSQSIKIINEEVQHLNEFVQECLNFVRPPNSGRFAEVEINEVTSVVINIVSHIYESESKEIKIVKELEPGLPKIYANYEEIKQAFLNIVKNAFEAMPEGGMLTIKARRQPDSPRHIQLVFIDTGVGIKQKNLESLFNPFFTTKLRGTGLGLAICRRIIAERYHGKIHIESEENKGTAVKIELPVGRRLGDNTRSEE